MKDEITIKEIKEAKAELERNLAKLVGDFEEKYDIAVCRIDFDTIVHRNEMANYKIRELALKVKLGIKL